jgi:hypothetical protein
VKTWDSERAEYHRTVLQAVTVLLTQKDYIEQRVRGNGGARDILLQEQSVILSGYFHSAS